MKICFLCGSVEPGKNGVGDYSRRLAGEFIRMGHQAFIVGMDERGIDQKTREVQTDAQTQISAYRWPSASSWKQRFKELEETLEQNSTTHLSVQFVLYAFDHHGLPYQFAHRLLGLKTSAHIHFTVHELWHQSGDMRWKQQFISYLQSRITRQLLKGFPSSLKHTSLPTYQEQLARMQLNARSLPIFSNIAPIARTEIAASRADAAVDVVEAAFFSQFSMHPSVCDFLRAFQEDCNAQGKSLSVTFIGGSPVKADDSVRKLAEHLGTSTPITHTGFLSAEEVSQKLHRIDFGISPVPRHVIGKSGSTAAFLSHGKAIAIPHTEAGESPDQIGFIMDCLRPALFTTPSLEAMQKSLTIAEENKHKISLSSVATQMIEDLNSHDTRPAPRYS